MSSTGAAVRLRVPRPCDEAARLGHAGEPEGHQAVRKRIGSFNLALGQLTDELVGRGKLLPAFLYYAELAALLGPLLRLFGIRVVGEDKIQRNRCVVRLDEFIKRDFGHIFSLLLAL